MRYASVCSGVEAPSVAWERMGWKAVFFSEIEEFPSEVLKARYPNVPNLGDMTKIRIEKDEITNGSTAIPFHAGDVDVFVGGTPCQDVSVAGRRAGLVEGSRSRLAFDFVRLAYEMRARWVIWENVPGVLSQNHGEDFAAFLSSLAGRDVAIPGGKWQNAGIVTNATAGNYGLAYRVLDAQYVRTPDFPFAIPQRRRRVFVVGHLGSWERAAEVLIDRQSLQRTPPPRREKGKGLASHAQGRAGNAGEVVSDIVRMRSGCEGGGKGALVGHEISHTLATNNDQTLFMGNTYSIGNGQVAEAMISSNECCQTLNCMHDHQAVLITGRPWDNDTHPTLSQSNNISGIGCSNQEIFSQKCAGLVMEPMPYESNITDARVKGMDGSRQTIVARSGTGGGNLPLVQERFCIDDQGGDIVHVNDKDIGCTVRATSHVPCVTEPCVVNDQGGSVIEVCNGTCSTLRAQTHGHEPIVGEPIAIAGNVIGREGTINGGHMTGYNTDGAMYTQTGMDRHAACVSVATPNGEDVSTTIDAHYYLGCGARGGQERQVVCYPMNTMHGTIRREDGSGFTIGTEKDPSYTLTSCCGRQPAVAKCFPIFSIVRRLYPVECERLMGFPDNYTKIPWKGKSEEECPDGHRYKACGNSMCVNCMEYLGRKIEEVESR